MSEVLADSFLSKSSFICHINIQYCVCVCVCERERERERERELFGVESRHGNRSREGLIHQELKASDTSSC